MLSVITCTQMNSESSHIFFLVLFIFLCLEPILFRLLKKISRFLFLLLFKNKKAFAERLVYTAPLYYLKQISFMGMRPITVFLKPFWMHPPV